MVNTKSKLRLETLIAQAASLSLVTYGDDNGAFESLRASDKDTVLWLLSDLIHEAAEILAEGKNE